jgi:hypothetical protein
MNKQLLLLVSFLALLFVSCTRTSTTVEEASVADTLRISDTTSTASSPTIVELPQDTILDYTGRFLAGLNQKHQNFFTTLEDDKYWQEYRLMMDSSWARMTRSRLKKMEEWEINHLSTKVNDTLPVFYPFSGPDFLHAYYLFPKTKKFVLAALEPIIEMPRIDTLSLKQRDEFLDTLANSLRDIFNKSYFITTHMKKDFKKVKGVLPFFYVFMERSGYELLESKFIYIDSLGAEREVLPRQQHWHNTPGIKITFRDRESREVKTLYYFSISISNQGIIERPGFVKFINDMGPLNTFVKSASYLMHDKSFVEIKKILLSQSDAILQDDTGIPYRDFKKDNNWAIQLYGVYEKPVKDFKNGLVYQTDLDSAYKKTKVETLPFSLGYHWGSDKQNYLLMKKVNR